MTSFNKSLSIILCFCLLVAGTSFQTNKSSSMEDIKGAWIAQTGDEEEVLLFVDGYFTHTNYSKSARKFISTRGGNYSFKDNQLSVEYEFDTKEKDFIGKTLTYSASVDKKELTIDASSKKQVYKRIDDGVAPLAGVWHITSRMQNDKLEPIHRTGTRKTLKILTGNRFQWAAIDPGTKQFSGTGGGTYTFIDGKYAEHIEFFSRDSSRIGAVLTFDGKLENGDWHHSGKSSKGDPIYEVWSKVKKQ